MKLHPLVRRSQVLIGKVGVGSQQNECSRRIVTVPGKIKHAKLAECLERSGAWYLSGFVELRSHHRGAIMTFLQRVYRRHNISYLLQHNHMMNIGPHAMNID